MLLAGCTPWQVQKGSFEREASEAGEDTDVWIFLKYFKILQDRPVLTKPAKYG
jgi:hypothetical protein